MLPYAWFASVDLYCLLLTYFDPNTRTCKLGNIGLFSPVPLTMDNKQYKFVNVSVIM